MASLLNLGGGDVALTFSSLAIHATWSVLNWNASTSSLFVMSCVVEGNVELIQFYSDNGTDFLGYGTLVGDEIKVVPEPQGLALAGILVMLTAASRRRARG